MKIILNKDVQNLGEEGDVKDVAPGYARNYLIPRGLGVTYTKQNLALLEGKKAAIEKRKEEKKENAAGLKERIEALNLQISMTVGENGRLFGSVTNAMISEELAKHGIEIERKKVEIPDHTIKTTGNSVVKVKLYGTEVASLKVTVAGPAGTAAKAAPVAPADNSTEAITETTVSEESASTETAVEEAAPEDVSAAEATAAEAEAPVEEAAPEDVSAVEATAAEAEAPAEEAAPEDTPAAEATAAEAEAPAEEAAPGDASAAEAAAPAETTAEGSAEEAPEEPAADAADEEPADRE